MESQFKDWKCRASALGHILTKQNKISENELEKIKILEDEERKGVNINGNKVKWTENKKNTLETLINKRDAKEELPSGVKTYLDGEYNHIKYKRRKILSNDDLIKGTIVETDSLKLAYKVYKDRSYLKNDKFYENDYIKGTPDVVDDIIVDIKSSRDKSTFDNATITSLYEWQIKGYIWLALKELKKPKGTLIYALVNTPRFMIVNKMRSWFNRLGIQDTESERWKKTEAQLERNLIVDVAEFKNEIEDGVLINKNYDFVNSKEDLDIHPALRVKRFDNIELTSDNIVFIKKRVKLCREYLIKKEKEDNEKILKYDNSI